MPIVGNMRPNPRTNNTFKVRQIPYLSLPDHWEHEVDNIFYYSRRKRVIWGRNRESCKNQWRFCTLWLPGAWRCCRSSALWRVTPEPLSAGFWRSCRRRPSPGFASPKIITSSIYSDPTLLPFFVWPMTHSDVSLPPLPLCMFYYLLNS